MSSIIQLRRGTTSQWNSSNPVLAIGEVGLNTTTKNFRVGDGSSTWSALSDWITSGGGGSGTVTSVGLTVPTGLSVTPSSITTSGTFAVTFASGYSIPTTSSQTNWDTAYGWGNHASGGYASLSGNNTFAGTQTYNGFTQTFNNSVINGKVSIGPSSLVANQQLNVTSQSATNKGLVVQGAASQTANLIEIQDSGGSQLFYVSPYSETWNKGNVYVGSAGNYGRLSVLTGAAVVGAVIRGAASQTANLQEWQNSAGSILAQVTSGGNIISNGQIRATETGIFGDVNQIANTRLSVYTRGVANKGIVIQGTASQTANLQEWQDSAGAVLSSIDSLGNLTVQGNQTWYTQLQANNLNFYRGAATYISNSTAGGVLYHTATTSTAGDTQVWSSQIGGLYVNPSAQLAASATPLRVKGSASQSGNLTEWQNSSSTVLSSITSGGALSLAGVAAGPTPYMTLPGTVKVAYAGTKEIVLRNLNQLRFENGDNWEYNLWAGLGYDSTTKNLYLGGPASSYFTANSNPQRLTFNLVGLLAFNSDARNTTFQSKGTNTRLIVKAKTGTATVNGATGSGTVVSYTTSAPHYFDAGDVVTITGVDPVAYNLTAVTIASTPSQASFTISNAATGTYVSGGTATVAQASNLQEWQNASGTVVSLVASNGVMRANSGLVVNNSSSANYTALQVTSTVTSGFASVIQGAASQTADLTQWQNSAGTALAKVDASGNFTMGANLTFTNPGIGVPTTFTFTKTNDNAWLKVTERSSDQTTYEFGMSDNPDGNDFFQWRFDDWQNNGTGWMPIQIGEFNTRLIAKDNNVYGKLSLPYNSGFFTYNGAYGGTNQEVSRYTPTNSTSQQLPKDAGSGTGTITVDATNYTGTGGVAYWVAIDGTGTFKWGTGSYSGTAIGSAITITGSAQTLQNGLTVTLSLTGHVVNDRWSFRAYPTGQVAIGGGALGSVTTSIFPKSNFIGLAIRGASGQTANLTEWQNSSGTARAFMTPSYDFRAEGYGAFGSSSRLGSSYLSVAGWNATDNIVQIRGVASQTGDLTQWQNSAGTIRARIDQDGQFFNTYGIMIGGATNYGATLNVQTQSGGVGAIIRGLSGQTVDLMQWQNNSGTVLSKVDASGQFSLLNPLLTSISTVGGGGAEGGQINFARTTDGTQYWSIDAYGSTSTPDLRVIENVTERFRFVSGGAISIGGSSGTSGQVLTSSGSGSAPTWTTVSGTSSNSFTTIAVPSGTNPAAASSTDTLTFANGSGISITGSSSTDTVTVALATAYGDTINPYASKTANYVLAAPNGSAGVPTFRAIVAADIPTLNQSTTGSAGSVANSLTVGTSGLKMTTGTSPWNGSAASTIDIDTAKVPTLSANNTFSGTQTINNTVTTGTNAGLVLGSFSSGNMPLKFTAGTPTATTVAGAIEYDQGGFYGTVNNTNGGRGVIGTSFYYTANATTTLVNNTSAQSPWGLTNGIYLVAGYSYEVSMYVQGTCGATSGQLQFLGEFGGTLVGSQTLYTSAFRGAAPAPLEGRANTSTTTLGGITSASTGTVFFINCTGKIVVTSSGYWNPKIGFSVASGSAPTTTGGSYVKVTPISNSAAFNIGAWT